MNLNFRANKSDNPLETGTALLEDAVVNDVLISERLPKADSIFGNCLGDYPKPYSAANRGPPYEDPRFRISTEISQEDERR